MEKYAVNLLLGNFQLEKRDIAIKTSTARHLDALAIFLIYNNKIEWGHYVATLRPEMETYHGRFSDFLKISACRMGTFPASSLGYA